jgi:hypothetical protein
MDLLDMAPAEARPEKNIGSNATTMTAAMVVHSVLNKPDLLNLNCWYIFIFSILGHWPLGLCYIPFFNKSIYI